MSAAIKSTSARRFAPTTYENTCNRCAQLVYSAEKIGPLKDFTFYHHGCFKCVVCGSKLTLKTYYNNQQDQDDKEVYCQSHVPKTGPGHLDGQSVGIKAALNVPKKNHLINEQIRVAELKSALSSTDFMNAKPDLNNLDITVHSKLHHYPPGHFDASALHIQHAVNQTKLNRSNGPRHSTRPGIENRINEFLDAKDQQNLEMLHRDEEDALYRQFSEKRAKEEFNISSQIKEEWEKELEKLTSRFTFEINGKKRKITTDEEKALTLRHQKEKEDLEKNMTIKLDRKKESLTKKLLEQERQATAELVEKQSEEMMNLITAKLEEFSFNKQSSFNKTQETALNPNSQNYRLNELELDEEPKLISKFIDLPQPLYPSQPPPPGISIVSKLEIYNDPNVFAELDQIAINVARENQKTFTDLVRQLTASCVTDVEKARAIFRWITVKNLNTIKFDENDLADTPMGILRGIKHGTESYHVLFKRLCSYAGLHCVVIKGYSKSAGYQPGVHFEDSRFRNSWNAVFVAGSWRFVQCNWGARHLVNAKEVPRQSSTTGSQSRSKSSTDSLRYEYDDHYFLTDPKEFIYEFFPLQPEWQLLRCPISLREFEELPFVRSLFFRYGLYFVDEDIQAVLKTDSSGAVTVRIGMPSYMTPSLIFHYNLKLIDDYSSKNKIELNDVDTYDGIVLKRFVMQSVIGNTVTFKVHATCPGCFIMDIFANSTTPREYVTGEPMKFKSVCKFKIFCEELRTVMVPLPDCASGEWGPLKAIRLFGLIPLTHEEALIFSGRDLDIQFRMSRPLTDFMASLHKNAVDERRLARYVSVSIDDDENLITFKIRFPDEGQYGLDIYTREYSHSNEIVHSEKQLLTHCCKYLINVTMSGHIKAK